MSCAQAIAARRNARPRSELPADVRALLDQIDAYCRRTRLSASRVGELALKHPGFIGLLRKRGWMRPATAARVRAMMERFPDGCTLEDVRQWRDGEAPATASEAKRLRVLEGVAAEARPARPDVAAVLVKAALPEVSEAIRFVQQKWPPLWGKLVDRARAQGRMPGELLVAAIEAGMDVIGERNTA